MEKQKKDLIAKILVHCWSSKSSSSWTEENPARGQCSVTALVVQDAFSGKIMKTKSGDQWHYYNYIDDERIDFTVSQFIEPLEYSDIECKRVEAVLDTDLDKYKFLSDVFRTALKSHPEWNTHKLKTPITSF